MNVCIFCGEPCRGNICEDCWEEIGDLVPKSVVNRLANSVASREKPVCRADEEDLEEA